MSSSSKGTHANVILYSAGVASLITLAMSHFLSKYKKQQATIYYKTEGDKYSKEPKEPKEGLGPAIPPELRYELNLRGKMDQIYIRHGPKPFEFNSEVVQVFDDMVSRSVPLYCEVIDLAIYWVQRHFISGTKIYDLGCSTGTTMDVLARSFDNNKKCHFVGVDNSAAMVKACQEKLEWTREKKKCCFEVHCSDIVGFEIGNASVVLMNYTLQFIPILKRADILSDIYQGLCNGGILLISEKVRSDCTVIQETCTWIYEDFKQRRKYTKREIARKKEALMNVLVPYTEQEMRSVLNSAGFQFIEIIAKWNNFTTFVARKDMSGPNKQKKKTAPKLKKEQVSTPNLEKLFHPYPTYLTDYLPSSNLQLLTQKRIEVFMEKGKISTKNLMEYEEIAKLIQQIPSMTSKRFDCCQNKLIIGDKEELTKEEQKTWLKCAKRLKPWKKGPLEIFGVDIDSEWRSDWKWERLQASMPELEDKVICDLGCGNGYYMFRMLEYNPKLIIGIDPNMHAFLEFKAFQRFSGVDNIHFEYLRGDSMTLFPRTFDVVFCLGVLYHTNDPIGMLRDIHKSMKGKSHLIVDCQGIPGEDPVALFPQKRYANMKGTYFLPTLNALKNWLQRTNFVNVEVIFSEKLSTEEQRITEWAPVHKSLKECLNPNNDSKTIEGYPAPHRFYVRAQVG